MSKSPASIHNYIDRINKLDTCIETKNGVPYKLNYTDLQSQGIFKLLIKCMKLISGNIEAYVAMNLFQKMEFLGVNREIIYMLDAYLLTNINKSGTGK